MTKIGLEIHCQLTKLKSKLFCSCKADYRGFEPNTNICPICVGLPGSLPLLNKKAVEKAAMIAMRLGCKVPPKIGFFRKNYFYPDLPKNFQITQYNVHGPTSIGSEGQILIEDKMIRISRIQIEEDPGRLIYEGDPGKSLTTFVDYNRSGTPLVEIVTEPDFTTPKQVRTFVNILSDLLDNLGVSDTSLEGALRVDANVSIDKGEKVEIKNIGSFRNLEKAIHFELVRQESLAERGMPIPSETRQWDEGRKITISARTKEEEQDYRYFPESDVPHVLIKDQLLEKLKENMPESIISKRERYVEKYGIPNQVAEVLSTDKFYSDLFEKAHNENNAKEIANLITTDLMGLADTKEKQDQLKLRPQHLSDLADAILNNKITRISAKTAIHEIAKTGKPLSEITSELDLGRVDDESSLLSIIDEVFAEEKQAVEDAKQNEETVNYLVGKVMQKTKGKANPSVTLEIIKKKLK